MAYKLTVVLVDNSGFSSIGALSRSVVDRTVVIHVPTDRYEGVPNYESFWDVPVAEVSKMESVQAAREEYAEGRQSERRYL